MRVIGGDRTRDGKRLLRYGIHCHKDLVQQVSAHNCGPSRARSIGIESVVFCKSRDMVFSKLKGMRCGSWTDEIQEHYSTDYVLGAQTQESLLKA
jgi:hypothetical protein